MDPAEILPLLLMMQILPALTGGGGGDIASDNVVVLPVAIGNLTISGGPGSVLPIGIEKDRRVNGRDRRYNPTGSGRRMTDQVRDMVFPIPPLSFLPA